MTRIKVLAGLLLAAFCAAAHAEYPEKPITLVVPFTAGSDADVSARNLAQHVPKYLGHPTIVVVNQPGASGAIGTQAVQKAAADGYTLLLARIASQVILPATDSKTPYRWGDFTYLGLLESNPYVCAVRRESPYASMTDLVTAIHRRPGKLNFATVGPGTLQHFGPQYLFSILGLSKDAAIAVPYKGSGELATALIAGQVDFACSNLGALLPHFRSRSLRALMTSTYEPLKELPDVPTARRLGWPAMEGLAAWSALAGPPDLPREVIQRWSEALAKLAADQEWVTVTGILGSTPAVRRPAETAEFVRGQYELYEKLSRRLGLRD
jgi:tripartite-type tricarboxylate transporter receptor subunit TctC